MRHWFEHTWNRNNTSLIQSTAFSLTYAQTIILLNTFIRMWNTRHNSYWIMKKTKSFLLCIHCCYFLTTNNITIYLGSLQEVSYLIFKTVIHGGTLLFFQLFEKIVSIFYICPWISFIHFSFVLLFTMWTNWIFVITNTVFISLVD